MGLTTGSSFVYAPKQKVDCVMYDKCVPGSVQDTPEAYAPESQLSVVLRACKCDLLDASLF